MLQVEYAHLLSLKLQLHRPAQIYSALQLSALIHNVLH